MHMSLLKVLLVDDDEDDYLIALDVLREIASSHYEVDWASSYESGLSALLDGAYDVCLLDYRLEGRTGLELLGEAQRSGCKIPVIMLTGVGDKEVDLAAMAAGAADYLVKGRLDATLLERTIRYAIERKSSERELKQYAVNLEAKNRELVAMHEELAMKNAALVRLNEEKNGFLGMAAHDLRNPLGVIIGYSDFLLMMYRSVMQKDEVDIIEKIKSSSKFMLSLINDLLDISTIESGKLNLDLRSTDLVELVEANVGLNTVMASRKKTRLVFHHDESIPRVNVDARKVEQVLNNLISNAIHYSYPETAIEVFVRHEGPSVLVSVKDYGPGIAKEDVGNLFKPFGRAKSVSTGGEKSTGLGLAIARRIIEGHGGAIWVESELGRGATFFVSFPVPRK